MVDRKGIPLAAIITGANRNDSMVFEEPLDAIEPIKRPRGRPRKRPEKLHADKGYDDDDDEKCAKALKRRGIKRRIARGRVWRVRRGLGDTHRQMGGGADAGVAREVPQALTIRYERREDIHDALLHLGCSLICLNCLM